MLRALVDKVAIMQDHMGNVSRKIEIQRKNQHKLLDQQHCNINKECLWLINKLNKAEERISELEDISKKTSNNKKVKRKKIEGKKSPRTDYLKTEGQL